MKEDGICDNRTVTKGLTEEHIETSKISEATARMTSASEVREAIEKRKDAPEPWSTFHMGEHGKAKNQESLRGSKGNIRVMTVAYRFNETGEVVTIPRPGRHHNLRDYILSTGKWPMLNMCVPEESEHGCMGFMLSDGSFARRPRAKVLALTSGQLPSRDNMIAYNTLTSEDLWDSYGHCIWAEQDDVIAKREFVKHPSDYTASVSLGAIGIVVKKMVLMKEMVKQFKDGYGGRLEKSPLSMLYALEFMKIRKVLEAFNINPINEKLRELYPCEEDVLPAEKIRRELQAFSRKLEGELS